MKQFCTSLSEHATNVIIFEKKKNVTVNIKKKNYNHVRKQEYVKFGEKHSQNDFLKMKIIEALRSHCHFTGKYRDAAHSIYNLTFNVTKEISVVFHKGANCGYHFIIKNQQTCLKDNLND